MKTGYQLLQINDQQKHRAPGKLVESKGYILTKKKNQQINYLNCWHGHSDMRVLSTVNKLHHGDALIALDILSRVLASGDKDSSHNVDSMGIEATKRSGHC